MLDNSWIGKNNIESVSVLIPDIYREALIKGELAGIVSCNRMVDREEIVGVTLFRRRKRWLEIVWNSISKDYMELSRLASSSEPVGRSNRNLPSAKGLPMEDKIVEDILPGLLSMFSDREDLDGAYAKFPVKEEQFARLLRDSGFSVEKSKTGPYEADMNMLDYDMFTTLEDQPCRSRALRDAGRAEKSRIVDLLKKDEREILPLPMPVEWDRYDPDLSQYFLTENSFSLLLASTRKGMISLDILISQNYKGLAAVLHGFITSVDRIYLSKARVVIPVISDEADQILHKLIPGAQKKEVYQAYKHF